jgi:hypothetical protein
MQKFILDAAIERAVDRSDKRLRALSGYRKALRDPVASAIQHINLVVDQLPSAVEISPKRYGNDPMLRVAFASSDHLHETLRRFQSVRGYLDQTRRSPPDEIFGLVTMSQRQRTVLGFELQGDLLMRDVLQTAVSFSDHRFVGPADSERRTRRSLKIHAFDFLLEAASQRIAQEKSRRGELILERDRLRRQMQDWKPDSRARSGILGTRSRSGDTARALRSQLQRIDADVGRYRGLQLGLQDSLSLLVDTLNDTPELLVVKPWCMSLDHRGIKVSQERESRIEPAHAIEVSSATGLRRIVFIAKIPRDEFPAPVDVVKRGESFLGGNFGPLAGATPAR